LIYDVSLGSTTVFVESSVALYVGVFDVFMIIFSPGGQVQTAELLTRTQTEHEQ